MHKFSTNLCIFFIALFLFWSRILSKTSHYAPTLESPGVKKDAAAKRGGHKHSSAEDEYVHKHYYHHPSSSSKSRRIRGYDDGDDDDDDNDDNDVSIEDVDDDKIEEIINENDKNLVILFYDRDSKCPHCREAISELEEIDDDLESTRYIEVVKSNDRRLAHELGVFTYPAMVYFRRKHPILYDDDFDDSDEVYRWIRAHDEVVTVHLDDGNFEDKTDSYSPSEGVLDWFVMFYDSKNIECDSYVPVWETVAHKLRGLVNVGKLDINESDDVASRFSVDDEDDCPTFLLFRKGKMYKYKETARDVKSFTSFALQKYKEQRGRRVPEPPTMLEEFYEDLKEELESKLGEHCSTILTIFGCLATVAVIGVSLWLIKSAKHAKDKESSSEEEKEKES